MPFTSIDDLLPRRNARSFDLDDSAAKAAAWVWHLHTSKPGVTTEGRFISSQSRRRSSSNYDRKATRFRQEASTKTDTLAGGNKMEMPMWDCGSKLYDTFELVSFSNRLDRSLMEVVPITPPQAVVHPPEHHMKSPLHEPGGILRTLSLPRQTSKHRTLTSSPRPNKFKPSKSYKNGTRERGTGSGQKASTKWSGVGKFVNVIKKVVVLHKQVNFVGCKRSINIIESSQSPIDPISGRKDNMRAEGSHHEKIRANYNMSNRRFRDSEGMGDVLPIHYTKNRSHSDIQGSYKLSMPSKDGSNYDKSSMKRRVRAGHSESLDGGLSMNKKIIRSNSESMSDADCKKIRARRKSAGDIEVKLMDNGIKGSSLEGVLAKESIKGANELVDHYKHLHHHHHHHHHHHYLHHNLASESARLSPDTLSHICAEQSWLI